MPRELGIIFSGPMVPALLAGTKTMTRRPIEQLTDPDAAVLLEQHLGVATFGHSIPDDPVPLELRCRYLPGDRLWVKESFRRLAFDKVVYRASLPRGSLDCHFKPWSSPLYLPRELSRITLEVEAVRAERLHAITEESAKAEGVPRDNEPCDHIRRSCAESGCMGPGYRSSYAERWMEMYDRHNPFAWRLNPWVWAVMFRVVETKAP